MKKEMELKKVRDLSYAGVLKSQNYKLQNISWESGVGWFIFEIDETAEEKLKAFVNGDLKGNIKEFDEAIKTLKQMLFSNKNN